MLVHGYSVNRVPMPVLRLRIDHRLRVDVAICSFSGRKLAAFGLIDDCLGNRQGWMTMNRTLRLGPRNSVPHPALTKRKLGWERRFGRRSR
jgi:hypothetical protein